MDQTSTMPPMQQALWHFRGGYFKEAEALTRQILQAQPNHPEALHLLALLAHRVGQSKAALDLLAKAIAIKPDQATLHQTRGRILAAMGQPEEALAAMQKVIDLHGENPDLYLTMTGVLLQLGRKDDAVAAIEAAIRLRPDAPELKVNLAAVLAAAGRVDEAVTACRQAVELCPDVSLVHLNLGRMLAEKGERVEALACFDKAVELDKESAEAHLLRGVMLLAAGDWAQGWQEYEWRTRCPAYPKTKHTQPAWDGAELGGKSILLYAEDDARDTIQFLRYAGLVEGRGGKVIVSCQSELEPLAAGVKGVGQMALKGLLPPAFDVQCALGSLPGLFGSTPETLPHDCPYISAVPKRIEGWRKKLPEKHGLKVGLAWGGPGDGPRAMKLDELAPLAGVSGVVFYALQKPQDTDKNVPATKTADAAADKNVRATDPPAGMDWVDMSNELYDLGETAALIANLDLVISADAPVAHLAGAMGKPVWTLVTHVPDWRWGATATTTPWYPTMRLFRQEKRADWAGVVEKVVGELAIAAKKARGSFLSRLFGRRQ